MATVTIGNSYFEALLRRSKISPLEVDFRRNLLDHVTISQAEHNYLLQSERDYYVLKSALFRGGLTTETLETLLAGESSAATTSEAQQLDYPTPDTDRKTRPVLSSNLSSLYSTDNSIEIDETETSCGYGRPRAVFHHGKRDSSQRDTIDDMYTDEVAQMPAQRVPLHDQRTVLISNLPERATHKDLTGIIRGGRLLEIFLRNDRTATISFIEGAADFLAYAKRTDLYLHTKRLEVRWADRQFHVPSHVSNKIANGATRNLVVRGAADAFISTNSIHNALFARTCMVSRTAYKGLRIEYTVDECAVSVPHIKPYIASTPVVVKPKPTTNTYAILDLETGSNDTSSSEDDSYLTEGGNHHESSLFGRLMQAAQSLPVEIDTMASIVKVAVIQLYPKVTSPTHNFKKAENFIRSAAAQGAELAVLPEYHLTNWLPKDPGFVGLCDQWETYLRKYQDLAKECEICIVPGTIVESHRDAENEADKLLNVCYFIDHQGTIAGKYIKKNLWGPERDHLTGSGRNEHEVFDTPIGKVGMLICWDLAFPEAFRELIASGAKIIIIPTFWTLNDCNEAGLKLNPSAEALFLDSMLTARAFENTCGMAASIIFANAGGPPGRGYAGLSQVTVPFVGALTKLGGCGEGMAVADIDMQVLEDAEDNYKVRSDIASEGWHYDYRHSRLKERL
ncbi:carbon-nitrogen hydrolase [Phaeosphaeria sp. MPI-PUGE-AT-0046c]|nr:carbon-nitrogen hydrolase [Phaeosphaeria sp. MPI-PUGE-AT-0046c]